MVILLQYLYLFLNQSSAFVKQPKTHNKNNKTIKKSYFPRLEILEIYFLSRYPYPVIINELTLFTNRSTTTTTKTMMIHDDMVYL